MSLNWSIEKCNFTDEFQKANWYIIEETIWSTMIVELGTITKENVDKFEFRLRCYQKISGNDYNNIIEFLPKMIGLTTNVADITDKKYEKKLIGVLVYDCQYDMKMERRKAEDDKRLGKKAEKSC